MDATAGSALRWSRALLLGVVAMGSGVLAHVSAGGLMPGSTALLVLLGLCVTTAASLLGRPASTLRVVVLLMSGQTVIHGALTAMSGHRGDPPVVHARHPATPLRPTLTGGDGRRVGSLYDQLYVHQTGAARPQLSVPAPVQHVVADLTGPHAAMALAHLAAAAAVGLWLAMGERALWTVLTLMADRVRHTVRHAVARHYGLLARVGWLLIADLTPRLLAPVAVEPVCPPLRDQILMRCVVRRGPPALPAA
jgi:hypothetical protein